MTSSSQGSEGRKRILLVEDDPTNRLLFTDYLSRQGYQLLSLPDGTALLEDLDRFQPDLLILDVGLPYIDGLTLLRRLRKVPRWQQLPVILMSTYVFCREHENDLNSGLKNYLVKPFKLRNLSALLTKLLSADANSP